MLTHISSADNSKVKLVRKLSSRKGRESKDRFVAEGLNLVSELIDGNQDIDFIMISESFKEDSSNTRKQAILEFIDKSGCDAASVSGRIFSTLSDAEHGIEVLAVVKIKRHGTEFIESMPKDTNILVCDRIQDPGNMGTMIRTAVAAGYGAVLALPGTVDIYSPKVLRATAGMVFEIPVIYAASEDELFKITSDTGRRLAVTVPDGGKVYYEENLRCGIALVIGNEGRGASKSIIERADVRITIPMKGNIESLNAAAAAAILMYEAVRE